MVNKDGATARVGIRDVAAAAGVSTTTVSHALSGARAINAETRVRVLDAAKRLGYSPDPRARGLRSARTYTIGLLSDTIAVTPYAGQMISGAQDAAAEHQSVLMILDSHAILEQEQLGIRTLRDHRVDGLVYARMYHQEVTVPQELDGDSVVLANASTSDSHFSSIVPDEEGIGLEATRHLTSFGHRRIGFTTIPESVPAAWGRERGYRKGLKEAGITVDESLIVPTSGDAAGGRAAARLLLDRPNRPTAIFCFNDEAAMGVYQAARELGLSIPHDVSVVGVDDLQLISLALVPTLTTIALPHYEMGRWAVSQLFGQVGTKSTDAIQKKLPCPLIQRGSVAPPLS